MTSEMTEPTQEERDAAATVILRAEGWYDDAETLEPERYDDCLYDAGAAEYLILTDAEADARAAEYVAETLWAFNAEFLAAYTPDGIDAEEINAMRGDRCEDANEGMLALVRAGSGLDAVTEDAISADGRGHFFSSYDGEELERTHAGRLWFVYRMA